MQNTKEKNYKIQLIKSIAIFSVVFGHFLECFTSEFNVIKMYCITNNWKN